MNPKSIDRLLKLCVTDIITMAFGGEMCLVSKIVLRNHGIEVTAYSLMGNDRHIIYHDDEIEPIVYKGAEAREHTSDYNQTERN